MTSPLAKEERALVTGHPADQLLEAVERVGSPACVGIDPVLARLPVRRDDNGDLAIEAIRSFTLGVLDAVAGRVPCVKLQSACFERYGHRGVAVLEEMIAATRERGLVAILDAKRGDIGVSSEHYAAAVFGAAGDDGDGGSAPRGADWVTVNPYLGDDGIRPFLDHAEHRGVFALVRTSNPAGDAIQARRLEDGSTVAECVAALVASIGREVVGAAGYSALGAVVGATKSADAARLREIMPQQIFLVPGYGAQGGDVAGVRPCFDASGRGAIVTASRSVIYADAGPGGNWRDAVAEAASRFAGEIARAVGMR